MLPVSHHLTQIKNNNNNKTWMVFKTSILCWLQAWSAFKYKQFLESFLKTIGILVNTKNKYPGPELLCHVPFKEQYKEQP